MEQSIDRLLGLFEEKDGYLRKLNKDVYEANTESFKEVYGKYVDDLLTRIGGSTDAAKEEETVAASFAGKVWDIYSKNGKMKMNLLMDLNFIMIYYIFPYLLKSGDENASHFAQTLKNKWNEVMGSNISYAPYEEIAEGFKKKLFGFF